MAILTCCRDKQYHYDVLRRLTLVEGGSTPAFLGVAWPHEVRPSCAGDAMDHSGGCPIVADPVRGAAYDVRQINSDTFLSP